jgi:hypothetical protein
MFAVEYIVGRVPMGVDVEDLSWSLITGHGDYTTLEDAENAAAEFDGAFERGAYTHRAVAVDSDDDLDVAEDA